MKTSAVLYKSYSTADQYIVQKSIQISSATYTALLMSAATAWCIFHQDGELEQSIGSHSVTVGYQLKRTMFRKNTTITCAFMFAHAYNELLIA